MHSLSVLLAALASLALSSGSNLERSISTFVPSFFFLSFCSFNNFNFSSSALAMSVRFCATKSENNLVNLGFS